jgi:signal transduction histidine kinase
MPRRAVDSTNSSFAVPPGLNNLGLAVAMYPDPAGGIWFALASGGVRHWRNGVLTQEPIQEETTALILDQKGNLWAAAISGPLIRLHQGIANPVSTEGGLVDARALAEDGVGRVWVGTEDGLVFRQQNERFIKVTLPGAKSGERVQFIVADGPEQVWIGLKDTGIYRWRAGKVDRLLSHIDTPVTEVRSLAIEPSGDFWIGTLQGLFRVQRSEIEAAMDGRRQTMRCNWFGRADGLPHIEFSFGFRNVTARTHDGHLWFATCCGALDVNPPKSPATHSLSPMLIEELEEAGRVIAPDGKQYTLGPKPKTLQIRYTLPELSQADQLCFRYRLVGLGESEWSSAGNRRIATFTNLPPGQFRFEVEGCEPGGAWLPAASVVLTVRAAWWQTLWFRLGMTLASVAGIALFVRQIERSRYRKRMRALEEKNAIERERARIARGMHDELGATLTQITLRSEIASRLPELAGAGARELGLIAKAVRSVSVTLDEIVWALNPSNDTLEQLAGYIAEFATEYLQATGIELDTGFSIKDGETRVTSNTRHQVVLAVKEVLNNIVKHSGAGEVTLKIAADASGVKISIADDGKGFDSATVSAFGNGVRNIQQRLSSIGGSANFSSQLGCGTQISFDVPL